MKQKKVFIVILNWNGKDDTIECVKSVNKIDYKNYEILIVDNGSKDNSVFEIKKKFPEIKIIENNENLGFAEGNNVGIRYAMKNKADFVLLLNNDTTVEKDFLTELIKEAELNKKTGIVGAKIYYFAEQKRIWFAGGKINWLMNKATHMGLNEIDNEKYNEAKNTDYLTGCCMLIKKEVIEKIGLLPSDYFLYYEDVDFCLRAQKAGYNCVCAPKAKVYHKISKSTKPGSASYIYYHVRNGLFLAKRNGSIFVKAAIYVNCVVMFVKQIIKIIFIPKKRNWGFAIIKAEKDFLIGKTGKE